MACRLVCPSRRLWPQARGCDIRTRACPRLVPGNWTRPGAAWAGAPAGGGVRPRGALPCPGRHAPEVVAAAQADGLVSCWSGVAERAGPQRAHLALLTHPVVLGAVPDYYDRRGAVANGSRCTYRADALATGPAGG